MAVLPIFFLALIFVLAILLYVFLHQLQRFRELPWIDQVRQCGTVERRICWRIQATFFTLLGCSTLFLFIIFIME